MWVGRGQRERCGVGLGERLEERVRLEKASSTWSAGRVAISRSGTVSPWRSGKDTAWDSTTPGETVHNSSPGGGKYILITS